MHLTSLLQVSDYYRQMTQIRSYKAVHFNHHPLLTHQSSQSWEKSAVNYYWSVGHVFLESRTVAIPLSTLFLSCPAGTTILSLHPTRPHPHHRCTHTHTDVDVCVCAGLVWWSSASTMPLYGGMTHGPACLTGVDFHSWSPLLKLIFPSANITSRHAQCLLQ